jgi:hypothetical protein
MKNLIVISLFALGMQPVFIHAQTAKAKKLAGYWQMTNTAFPTNEASLLRIISTDDCAFNVTYKDGREERQLSGMLYETDLVSAVENSNEAQKNVYTGQLLADGTIQGYYFSSTCGLGEFVWTKVCDEMGRNLSDTNVPCLQDKPVKYTIQTKIVKKMVPVEEEVSYVGETRNEAIPLATTTTIPSDAVYVGAIETEKKITYKEVEVEETVQEPVYYQYEETVTNDNYEPEAVIPANSPAPKKKLQVCDIGTPNPNAPKRPIVRGKTVKENGNTYHIVGAGETMFLITKLYGISIQELAELNNKDCERVFVGEKLRVK